MIYKPVEFAKIVKVSTRTLRNWEKAGTLVPCKYPAPSKRKYYTEEQLQKILSGGQTDGKKAN